MINDLSASAVSAGALFSNSRFEVPIYQREYSWTGEEVKDFWDDLSGARSESSYFLGLLILTESGERYHVVDGQQRILTLTLLVAALRDEAKKYGREALAEKINADFIKSINYQTDAMEPRVILSGEIDNATLGLITSGQEVNEVGEVGDGGLSRKVFDSFRNLRGWLEADIASDPFRKLGEWASFLTSRVYFAVFTHPDPASAYRVFEAINTRGKSLTTADLLKNYLLSQTRQEDQRRAYERWQQVAEQFSSDSGLSFVQYIRHIVTVRAGHILPKQLYDYLARRGAFGRATPPPPLELLSELEDRLPLYIQMMDPSVGGPADEELLKVYRAFNQLSVITVRPILLALFDLPTCLDASRDFLRFVVRRIVVGNLGTGNVERRFAEAAKKIKVSGDWVSALRELGDLNPAREDFISQIARRSFNKSTLAFLRKSVVDKTIVPDGDGALHLIRIKSAVGWGGFDDEELLYWVSTMGNTFLAHRERRPRDAADWQSFKRLMLPDAVDGEFVGELEAKLVWNAQSVQEEGARLAEIAAGVWYD